MLNLTLNAGLTGTTDEINFDLVLPPLTNFATSSTATIGGSANIGLNFTIGMTNAGISLIALKPMASNGRLTADAVLDFLVDSTPVSVVVTRASTATNTSRADFIADLNAALVRGLRLANLDPTLVRADLANIGGEQRIALRVTANRASSVLLLAAEGSVANLELGFGVATTEQPVINTGAQVPLNGQLAGNLTFAVFVDGQGIGTVTVTAASTNSGAKPNLVPLDLIDDINAALAPINDALRAAGKQITASINTDGTLAFSASGNVGSFTIATDPADSGARQFGLRSCRQALLSMCCKRIRSRLRTA